MTTMTDTEIDSVALRDAIGHAEQQTKMERLADEARQNRDHAIARAFLDDKVPVAAIAKATGVSESLVRLVIREERTVRNRGNG